MIPKVKSNFAGLSNLLLFFVVLAVGCTEKKDHPEPQFSANDRILFKELRDEGIKNIGWVAGNSSKHPIWPQAKEYVDRGGLYYNAFVLVKVPNSDSDVEALSNRDLYQKWRAIGEKSRFDEPECMRRIARSIQISDELSDLLDKYKS